MGRKSVLQGYLMILPNGDVVVSEFNIFPPRMRNKSLVTFLFGNACTGIRIILRVEARSLQILRKSWAAT